MTLFNQSREINTKESSLCGRFFKGVVKDNNDPLKLGRCRIYVAQVHKEIDGLTLPWSLGANAMFCGPKMGGLNVPAVGSKVWLLFCSDDFYSSLYFAGSRDKTTVLDEDFEVDYPNCYGTVDDAGNLFVVNKVKGYVKSQLISGATICWDNKGLTINTSNVGPGINEVGFNLNVLGPINLKCSGDFRLDANNITLASAGSFKLVGSGSGEVSCSGGLKLEGSTVDIAPGGGPSESANNQPKEPKARTKPVL